MPEYVINSGGLGATGAVAQTFDTPFTVLTPGAINQCNGWGYFITIPCWGLSRDAWAQAAALQVPNAAITNNPAPAPACALTPPYVCTDGDQQSSLDAGQVALDAANLAQAQNQPDDPLGTDMCEQFTMNWPAPFDGLTCPTVLLYGIGGLVLFLVGAKLLEKL